MTDTGRLRGLLAKAEIPLPCATGEDVGFPLLITDETGCELARVEGRADSPSCRATASLIAEALNRLPALLAESEELDRLRAARAGPGPEVRDPGGTSAVEPGQLSRFAPVGLTRFADDAGRPVATLDLYAIPRPQSRLVQLAPALLRFSRAYADALGNLVDGLIEKGKDWAETQELRKTVCRVVALGEAALAGAGLVEPPPSPAATREEIASMLDDREARVRALAALQECTIEREALALEANTIRDAAEAVRTGHWSVGLDPAPRPEEARTNRG